jgi:hypothetical protein
LSPGLGGACGLPAGSSRYMLSSGRYPNPSIRGIVSPARA